MQICLWVAKIAGHEYIYYKSRDRKSKYRTHYLALPRVVEELAARGVNEAALQMSAKTTFDEAKEVVKALRGFVEELEGELRRALEEREAGEELGSQISPRAVALEVALEGKSDIMTEIWAATSLPGITALCICRAA